MPIVESLMFWGRERERRCVRVIGAQELHHERVFMILFFLFDVLFWFRFATGMVLSLREYILVT